MTKTTLVKTLALFAAVAFVTTATTADAQMTKGDAKCRATIAKTTGKLAATIDKAIGKCHKDRLKGKVGPATDCNNSAVADTKGKISKAAQKLRDSVGGVKDKCKDKKTGAVFTDVLAAYPSCPSPGDTSDDGGATSGIDSFSELAECMIALATKVSELTASEILGSPDTTVITSTNKAAKAAIKCHGSIAKAYGKLVATIVKERAKCQKGVDKALGPISWACGGTDPKGKILKASTKLNASIDKACIDGPTMLNALDSCGDTAAQLKDCIANTIAPKSGAGLVAMAYELPGACPTGVTLTINSGNGDQLTDTALDVGWNGLGHGVDVIDGFDGAVNLACDGDCQNCAVTVDPTPGNCRCSNDETVVCTQPFTAPGTDPACGPGNECICLLGPPLPLSASGVPVCVINKISEELVGTADAGTGESDTTVSLRSVVHATPGAAPLSVVNPCPSCVSGTCNAGKRAGLSCSGNDATHPTFGGTSYDCPPDSANNVSGNGLAITLDLVSGTTSLGFDVPCATFPTLTCACQVCSGDTSLPCNSDSECAAAGAGTCSSAGAGAAPLPNGCTDGVCTDNGDGTGSCGAGPVNNFCDGQLRANGDGYLTCSSDADCDTLDSVCDGGDCGSCVAFGNRSCYVDPIEASGQAGLNGAFLVSTFCNPPTSSSSINEATGNPGAGRVQLDFDFTGLCSDGSTVFEGPGGSNCP